MPLESMSLVGLTWGLRDRTGFRSFQVRQCPDPRTDHTVSSGFALASAIQAARRPQAQPCRAEFRSHVHARG